LLGAEESDFAFSAAALNAATSAIALLKSYFFWA
jgi:hypothetical protein